VSAPPGVVLISAQQTTQAVQVLHGGTIINQIEGSNENKKEEECF